MGDDGIGARLSRRRPERCMQNGFEATERLQAAHYDRIADGYAAHYGDRYSRLYRDRFINKHMFAGLELNGLKVLEAMCGSGETTGYLLERGAEVTGLDVSSAEVEKFVRRWPAATGIASSIFETALPSESFDCVVVVGGLHHLHPHLSDGVREMHRILKPGGSFCFAEPHKGTIVDSMRQFWYQHDDLFADNEEAIDVAGLRAEFADRFRPVSEVYTGNIGYLFVLNSMVFRVPLSLKRLYSPLLLGIEGLVEKFQGPTFSCIAVARWEKI